MSEQDRISQPLSREELNEVVRDYLIDKLRDFLSVVFIGAISTTGSSDSEEVGKKNNTELLNMTSHDGYFTEVIAEIIRRLENGTMQVHEVASGREIEEFGMNPDKATFLFINDVVACHLNFLALMAGQIVQRAGENARVQMPPLEDLAITIKDLDDMGLIHHGELSMRIRVPNLVDALKEGIKSHSWTIPPPQSVVPVSPGRVDAKAKTELAIPTPVPPTQNSSGDENLPVLKVRSATLPAGAAPPAKGSAPGAPQTAEPMDRDSAPEITIHNDPNSVFAPLVQAKENGAVSGESKEAAPAAPQPLIRGDAENPDMLIMPIAVIKEHNGRVLEVIPLFSGRKMVSEGQYSFSIGSDPRNDIVVSSGYSNVDDFHATILINMNRTRHATTRTKPCPVVVFDETKNAYIPAGGPPVLASEREIPHKTALVIGGDKFKGSELGPDFSGVILEIETDTPVTKEELRQYLAGRMTTLVAKRAELMEGQGALIMNQPLRNLPLDPDIWDLDREWAEIVEFDQRFSIGAIDVQDLDVMLGSTYEVVESQVQAAKAKLVEANQVEIQRMATARLAAEKIEESKKERQQKIEARRQKEGLDDLHILSHEDPETVEIVHRCPVFEVRGTTTAKEDLPRTYAFLIPRFSIGKHDSNIVELYETDPRPKPDNAIHDFMADISYDPVTNIFTYHRREGETRLVIDGSLRRPVRYTFPIDVGQKVRVGRYLLEITKEKVGFSAEALHEESNELVDELLEKIFDKTRTTDTDDRNAHLDVKRIFRLPLPSGKKRAMAANVQRKYKAELEEVRDQVMFWDSRTPAADAELIRTLKMLMDFSREPKSFVPDCKVNEGDLKNFVEVRRERYMEAGRKVYGRRPVMVWLGEKYPSLSKRMDRKTKSFMEARKSEAPVAEMGAIEIARFMEMGLCDVDDLKGWNVEPYVERIERIKRIRELIEITRTDYAKQLESIVELHEVGNEMTMGEVFTVNEVEMKGLHVEMKVTCETSVDAYVHQVAKFIARKAYRKLAEKTRPDEMEREVALIKGLFAMNLITVGDISEYGEMPEQVLQKVAGVEAQAVESKRRLTLELEEQASHVRQEAALRTRVEEERVRLVLLAEDARKKLLDASAGAPNSGSLEDLMALAPIMLDANVAQAMQAHGLKIEGIEKEIKHVANRRQALIEGSLKFVTTPVEETWQTVQNKWRSMLLDAASTCVTQAVIDGLDAYYIKKLVEECVSQNLFTLDEIGTSTDDLEKGVAVEKRKRYEKTAYAADLDDTSFLREKAFGGLANGAESSEFEQSRIAIARRKLEVIGQKVLADDDAYYMKKVAREILDLCPEAGVNLLPEMMRALSQ